MKATTILYMVVIIAGVLSVMGSYMNELNVQYSDANYTYLNTSAWQDKYDYSNTINDSIGQVKSNFDTITDTDKSWFTRIGAGIVAIPYAVVIFPLAIFQGSTAFTAIVTKMTTDLHVPPALIGMAIILIIITVVTRLLEFFQRSPA